MKPSSDMNYSNYLMLEQVLSSQNPRSTSAGKTAHDEHLFIIVHQAYELWFKQMLYDLDSILLIFRQPKVNEDDMGVVVSRLNRINKIFNVIIQHLDVLETMTPLDFLEFRDLIYKASGFQSAQFRLLENKLGLRPNDRVSLGETRYSGHLVGSEQKQVLAAEHDKSLFDCLESWLGRTPFLESKSFKFWDLYKEAANLMFHKDSEFINSNPNLSADDKKPLIAQIEQMRGQFSTLFDENEYQRLQKEGVWRLSFRAIHAALLIQVYRDKPAFQQPFRLITEVLDLDSHMTQWRYRHVLMVKRMLGSRIGTGGSSGAKYLQESADKHRIFDDFYKLTTFFIPRSKLPDLPPEFNEKLGFRY